MNIDKAFDTSNYDLKINFVPEKENFKHLLQKIDFILYIQNLLPVLFACNSSSQKIMILSIF